MSGLREKLRRFQMNWLVGKDAAAADPIAAIGFKFNADDTPRSWSGDVAAFWPMAQLDIPPRDLPRFANVATHDGQLAA
jgi:hypothetical protein